METPRFFGRVDAAGAWHFVEDQRRALAMWLSSLAGQDIELLVRKRRNTRSSQQNRYWHGVVVVEIAHACGYERDDAAGHDLVHYALVAKCFGTTWNEKLKADVPNRRSSKLSTTDFAELMEWGVRHAATEYGLYIELPDERTEAA